MDDFIQQNIQFSLVVAEPRHLHFSENEFFEKILLAVTASWNILNNVTVMWDKNTR